jgi:hypothetical protein
LEAVARPVNDAIRICILVLLPWQQCAGVMRRMQQMWCSVAAQAAEIACFAAFP